MHTAKLGAWDARAAQHPQVPYWLLYGALALGALLRLNGLTRQSFWTDELYVIWEARQPLDRLFDPHLHIQHPPGYRLLLHTWLGPSVAELWARLLPALAGLALIGVVWLLARSLWPTRPGIAGAGALLVATSPFLLHYSQDITTYSWTTLVVTGSIWLAVQAWRTNRPGWWAAWAGAAAIALYSHYFSIFPVGLLALVLLARAARRDAVARARLRPVLLAWSGIALLGAPWVVVLLARGQDVLGTPLFPLSVDRQPLHWVPVLLAGYAHQSLWDSPGVLLGFWGALAGVAGWALWRRARSASRPGASAAALLAGWALAATAGPYLFLRLTTPPAASDPVRFATMAAPPILLALAAGAGVLPPVPRGLLLGGWLALAGVQWGSESAGLPTQDWRQVMQTIAGGAQPGDRLLAFPAFHAGAAAAYYPIPLRVQGGWFVADGTDPHGAAYWFPPSWRWQGFLDPVAARSTDWTAAIQARIAGAQRLWYLAGDGVDGTYAPSPRCEAALAALGWRLDQEWRASPLVLRRYVHP